MKQYQNIVTDKPCSYQRYEVINSYETLEEAKENYEKDSEQWEDKHKGSMFYKLGFPFGFATIGISNN